MGRNKIRFDEALCDWCGEIKKLEEFHKNSRRSNGVSSTCKACSTEKRRFLRQKNRKEKLLKEYEESQSNLPFDVWESMK